MRSRGPRAGEAAASFSRALLALALCAAVPAAQAQDSGRGPALYEICGACHGPTAGGLESLAAPPLAGREAWYLLRQLRNFSSGARGGKADPEAEEMRQILAVVPTESDWQAVLDTVRTSPRPPASRRRRAAIRHAASGSSSPAPPATARAPKAIRRSMPLRSRGCRPGTSGASCANFVPASVAAPRRTHQGPACGPPRRCSPPTPTSRRSALTLAR